MTFNDNLAAHYANVEQSNIMNSFIKYYIDSELVALKNLVLDSPPETLDTLNELAAALGDDPAFFSNMSAANTTLQNNIDALAAAAQAARDLIQADVDANETAAASALSTETSTTTFVDPQEQRTTTNPQRAKKLSTLHRHPPWLTASRPSSLRRCVGWLVEFVDTYRIGTNWPTLPHRYPSRSPHHFVAIRVPARS